jgi:hypothetical protein
MSLSFHFCSSTSVLKRWIDIVSKIAPRRRPPPTIWLYSPSLDLDRLTYRRFSWATQTDSLNEWSARRKAYTYTGQHSTERRGRTSMPWAGFEPTIAATNRPRPTPQTARPLWPASKTVNCTWLSSFCFANVGVSHPVPTKLCNQKK